MRRTTSILPLRLLALTGLLAIASPTFGGQSVSSPASTNVQGRAANPIDIEFPGGTVLDFVRLVANRAAFEGFVIHDAETLGSLRLPAVTLRGGSIHTALDLLTAMTFSDPRGESYAVSPLWVGPASHGRSQEDLTGSACVIACRKLPSQDSTRISRRAVFDLSGLADGSTAAVQPLVEAIRLAVEFDGAATGFGTTYHEPSKLLIAKGTAEELALVREIIHLRAPSVRGEPLPAAAASAPVAVTVPAQAIANDPPVGGVRLEPASDVVATTVVLRDPPEIPEPLTDAEVAAMTVEDAKERLARIASARQRSGLDADTRERLKREFHMVLTRLKSGPIR